MKMLLFSLALLSFSAISSETFLPDSLDCNPENKVSEIQEFSLRKINTPDPTMSSQFRWLETRLTGDYLTMDFSQNNGEVLTLKFLKEDLRNLKLGLLTQVLGTLTTLEEGTTISCVMVK